MSNESLLDIALPNKYQSQEPITTIMLEMAFIKKPD
uniref:Uncharacterized protein n=1 Tax=Rhizophora mucronata TaxID=61149 RepID=A0A2P2QJH4_RHIMU